MLFTNAHKLADHQKKSHPACSVCSALFTGIPRIRQHEIKDHGLLPYACQYCAKRFNHKAHRDLHEKALHTGERRCHCDICGKGYAGASMLKTHRMTHFEKTLICDICGKSFYHAGHLTRHKLVHQDVPPYQCATCGWGFTQVANLRSRQTVHSGERQLCSVCGKMYHCLKNHIFNKHAKQAAQRRHRYHLPGMWQEVLQPVTAQGSPVDPHSLWEELPSEGAAVWPPLHPQHWEPLDYRGNAASTAARYHTAATTMADTSASLPSLRLTWTRKLTWGRWSTDVLIVMVMILEQAIFCCPVSEPINLSLNQVTSHWFKLPVQLASLSH